MCVVLSCQFVVTCYSSNRKLINRVTLGENRAHLCPQSLILEGPAGPGGDGKLRCLGQGRETGSSAQSGAQGWACLVQLPPPHLVWLWPVAPWVLFLVWGFLALGMAPSLTQPRLHQAGLSLESGPDFQGCRSIWLGRGLRPVLLFWGRGWDCSQPQYHPTPLAKDKWGRCAICGQAWVSSEARPSGL